MTPEPARLEMDPGRPHFQVQLPMLTSTDTLAERKARFRNMVTIWVRMLKSYAVSCNTLQNLYQQNRSAV